MKNSSPEPVLTRPESSQNDVPGGERFGAEGGAGRRIAWIGGWGISPERWRPLAAALPVAAHRFLAPVRGAAEAAADSDWVVAWSLGAWRVLAAAAGGVVFRGRVWLLAPFVAFGSEYGLGGRCSVSQVRWLRRWMERDPAGALNDFCQRARLEKGTEQLPYGIEELLEGLDRLAEDASGGLRSFAGRGLPAGWKAVVGGADSLLEAGKVQESLPGCRVVPGIGHAAEGLLAALESGSDAV